MANLENPLIKENSLEALKSINRNTIAINQEIGGVATDVEQQGNQIDNLLLLVNNLDIDKATKTELATAINNSVSLKAFPSTTKLYEVIDNGVYLTPASGIEDLPTGWTQGRHTLIVFSVANPSYNVQLLIPYRPATSTDKRMAFRVALQENSAWREISTTETVDLTSYLLNGWEAYANMKLARSGNVVNFNIRVRNGVTSQNTTILQVPTVYRPTTFQTIVFTSPATGLSIGVGSINTDGALRIWSLSSNSDVVIMGGYVI